VDKIALDEFARTIVFCTYYKRLNESFRKHNYKKWTDFAVTLFGSCCNTILKLLLRLIGLKSIFIC